MPTAIIYARVSTTRQAEEGISVESQIERAREKAAALGADVVQVFRDEGKSGRTAKRPAFLAAIEFCAVAHINFFIVWSSSRFARNHVDAGMFKRSLRKHGTRVVSVTSDVDGDTDDGWIIESMSALMDENYSRQVSRDTRRSMLANARAGYFNGGRVPLGYRAVNDGKRKRLAVDEIEAAVVRSIFAAYLNGAGTKVIAMTLNRDGITRRGRPWTKNNVTLTLRNWTYGGAVVFNRVDSDGIPRPRDQWIITQSHPPIVDIEQLAAVEARFEGHVGSNRGGTPRSNFVFTGLMRCADCRLTMQMESATGRSSTYHYYNCRSAQTGRGCLNHRVPAADFDEWMVDLLADRLLSPGRVKRLLDEMRELAITSAQRVAEHLQVIDRQLADVKQRRSKLFEVLELLGKDAPNMMDLTVRLREATAQIGKLDAERRRIVDEGVPTRAPTDRDLSTMTEFLRDLLAGEDPRRLREFFGSFVSAINVGADSVEVIYQPDRIVGTSPYVVHRAGRWLPDQGSNLGPAD
jgi:site-specific DNA recombinase